MKLYNVTRRAFALVVDGLSVLGPNLPSFELLALAGTDDLTHSCLTWKSKAAEP